MFCVLCGLSIKNLSFLRFLYNVISCSLDDRTNVSEELAAYIFRVNLHM
jgi:hypothetical protein